MVADQFQRVEAEVARLRDEHRAGRLSDDAFAEALKAQTLQHDGRWWMVGADSGDWYVHDGARWKRQNRPLEPDAAKSTKARSTDGSGDWPVLGMLVGLTGLGWWWRHDLGYAKPMMWLFAALSLVWAGLLRRDRGRG